MKLRVKNGKQRSFGISALLFVGILLTVLSLLPERVPALTVSLSSYTDSASIVLDEELAKIFEEFKDLLPSGITADTDSLVKGIGIESLIFGIVDGLSGKRGEITGLLSGLVGIALILSLSELFMDGREDLSASATAAVSTVLSIPVLSSLYSLTSSVGNSLNAASEFFGGLIPLSGAVLSAGGLVSTGAAQQAAMSLTLGLVSGFMTKLLLPLVGAMFIFSAAASNDSLSTSAASGIKALFAFLVGGATTVLVGTLALQTVITSAADSVTMRGVKYAVSNMVPAIGSVISGSLSTLTSGVAMMAAVMGGASASAICSLFAAPIAELLLYRLILKISVCVVELLGASSAKKTLSSFCSATDSLIVVTVSCFVIFILEIVLFMKHGVGVT